MTPDSKTALSVNVNKVALLRNSRHLGIPSVLKAAQMCLEAGAQGITIHPRPDERHIRASDVFDLADLMKRWPDREFNIEGNPFHQLMDFVAAPSNLRARQRGSTHQRSWLVISQRCRHTEALD